MTNLEWVNKLIAFDTSSFRSNLGLIETVRDYFAAYEIESFLTYDPSHQKANLFATVPAFNGVTRGGIVLSGHTDVVPVKGQKWLTDPFNPTVIDGKLYGRGACDMKGFIGIALSKLDDMKSSRLEKPIHFALSYDEELCCAGAPSMIAEIVRRGIEPDGCIVGEPTEMSVVVAHKGISAYRCEVKGKAAHSSLVSEGVNSIEYASRLITFISNLSKSKSQLGPFDKAFATPHSTAQTGKISGGIAVNTIPEYCEFDFEFRNLPEDSPVDILEKIEKFAKEELTLEMKRISPASGIFLESVSHAPALQSSGEDELTHLAQALSGRRTLKKVGYATEAGLFKQAGIPTVVCGPGNIEQAHKANEYVTIEQLNHCSAFIDGLIQRLSPSLSSHDSGNQVV